MSMQSQVMNFWLTLAGYEAAWLCTVSGAGAGLAWPGVLAAVLFVGWRLVVSRQRRVECLLLAVALLLGVGMESAWVGNGWVVYASSWKVLAVPVWILTLWACFAVTILPLFGYLRGRPWAAACIGGIGGPLAYAAAARGWHAVAMSAPAWRGWAAIAVGWAVALPLLVSVAHRQRKECTTASGPGSIS